MFTFFLLILTACALDMEKTVFFTENLYVFHVLEIIELNLTAQHIIGPLLLGVQSRILPSFHH